MFQTHQMVASNSINFEDTNQIEELCICLKCTKQELHYCLSKVGNSIPAIKYYFGMNGDIVRELLKKK